MVHGFGHIVFLTIC